MIPTIRTQSKAPLLLGLLVFVFAGCAYYKDSITDKSTWLKQSAGVLRSAIDTNQIELACTKLMNQPEIVIAIRTYSQQAIADLDEAASLLTNPKLKSYGTEYGEGAEIVDPKNPEEIYCFNFQSNGQIWGFTKRVAAYNNGRQRVLKRMAFYSNGRLAADNGGHLTFKEDGELDHCFINGKYMTIK